MSRAFTVTLLCLAVTATAYGGPGAKAFQSGCWIGKSAYSGTYASGPVRARVTNGKQTMVLWVGPDKANAVGFLTVTGVGTGTLGSRTPRLH
jgi:hypothetical protein